MTDTQHRPGDGGDREIGRLLRHAYHTPVDVESASRHLWRLHQVARSHQAPVARRSLVSALAAVLLFATTGTAVAMSGQAVPGDSLYPVKRSAERVHLLVSFAPASDARLHLRFARSRVAEAEQVAATRPETVPRLLSDLVASVDQARTAGGPELEEEIDLVRREASTALASLGVALDTELAASLDDAIRALDGEALAAGTEAGGQGEGAGGQGEGAGGQGEQAGSGSEGASGTGEPAGPGPAGGGTQRVPAPDRASPPPAEGESGGIGEESTGEESTGEESTEPDGEAGGPDDAGAAGATPQVTASPDPAAQPPPPAPEPAPGAEEVAAEGTMPRLERLEGLLRRP